MESCIRGKSGLRRSHILRILYTFREGKSLEEKDGYGKGRKKGNHVVIIPLPVKETVIVTTFAAYTTDTTVVINQISYIFCTRCVLQHKTCEKFSFVTLNNVWRQFSLTRVIP